MATVNQAITNKGSGPQNRRFALVLVRCFGRYVPKFTTFILSKYSLLK